MKKQVLSLLLLVLAFNFVGCNKEDEGLTGADDTLVFVNWMNIDTYPGGPLLCDKTWRNSEVYARVWGQFTLSDDYFGSSVGMFNYNAGTPTQYNNPAIPGGCPFKITVYRDTANSVGRMIIGENTPNYVSTRCIIDFTHNPAWVTMYPEMEVENHSNSTFVDGSLSIEIFDDLDQDGQFDDGFQLRRKAYCGSGKTEGAWGKNYSQEQQGVLNEIEASASISSSVAVMLEGLVNSINDIAPVYKYIADASNESKSFYMKAIKDNATELLNRTYEVKSGSEDDKLKFEDRVEGIVLSSTMFLERSKIDNDFATSKLGKILGLAKERKYDQLIDELEPLTKL